MLANIALIIVIAIALRWIYGHLALRYRLKTIPAAPSYPFIGDLLLFHNSDLDDYYMLWKDLIKRYGKQDGKSMFVIWIGPIPFLSLQSPQHVEIILSNSKFVKKSFFYEYLKDLGRNGLFLSNPEIWREQRRMLTPSFHIQRISQFAESMEREAKILNECIADRVNNHPNTPIEIHHYIARCILATLCECAIGIKVDIQYNYDCSYLDALEKYVKLWMKRTASPWLYADFIYYKTKEGREYKQTIGILHEFTHNIIQQRQAERANMYSNKEETDDRSTGKNRKPFLDFLLDISENANESVSIDCIQQHVDEFLFAGYDTTTTSIVWTLFILGNNFNVQDRVHEEMDAVFGNDDKETITQTQLRQLKYLDMVIKESLRMYPSGALIGRCLTEDTWIDGILIPKNTDVAILIEQMHNDPEIWENPSIFDPDRFLPENSKNRHPYAYIPFSAGPRNCIGQKFAQLHEKIVLATLLRKWRVESLVKPNEISLKWYVTMTSKEHIKLFFIPRT